MNKALELDPNDGEAHNELGYVYLLLGDFPKAIEHLKRYAALRPGEANPLDSLAEAYFEMGQLDEALANYQEELKINPALENPYFCIGYIYALKAEYDEAIGWIDKFIAASPSPEHKRAGYLWKGFCRFWSGSLKDCDLYFREAEEYCRTRVRLGTAVHQLAQGLRLL